MGPENAEKKRKAEEKERECDRQATEKRNQCLAQPALGSSQNRWSAVGRYGS
jgi:hypothetical protein